MNVLLDLDGTLTDSAPGITRSLQHALREMGVASPGEDALRRYLGPPLRDSFRELLGTGDGGKVDEAIARYREYYATTGILENELFAGVPEALAALWRDGFRLFVATSKPTVYAQRILDHFGLSSRLGGVYGSELSGERADKAELLRHLLSREGLAPGGTVMVGDREQDVRGARAAGLAVIGVLWGYGTREELTEAGADALVASPDELVSLLRRRRAACGAGA